MDELEKKRKAAKSGKRKFVKIYRDLLEKDGKQTKVINRGEATTIFAGDKKKMEFVITIIYDHEKGGISIDLTGEV